MLTANMHSIAQIALRNGLVVSLPFLIGASLNLLCMAMLLCVPKSFFASERD